MEKLSNNFEISHFSSLHFSFDIHVIMQKTESTYCLRWNHDHFSTQTYTVSIQAEKFRHFVYSYWAVRMKVRYKYRVGWLCLFYNKHWGKFYLDYTQHSIQRQICVGPELKRQRNISLKHDLFGENGFRKKALGCLNGVCSIMCHNYTTWQMSSFWAGYFHPMEKKKLALRVSEAPPFQVLISPMSQQKVLCNVSRGRLKEKGGTFTCSSLLCVCSCVCARSYMQYCAHFSCSLCSVCIFVLLFTHTLTETGGQVEAALPGSTV